MAANNDDSGRITFSRSPFACIAILLDDWQANISIWQIIMIIKWNEWGIISANWIKSVPWWRRAWTNETHIWSALNHIHSSGNNSIRKCIIGIGIEEASIYCHCCMQNATAAAPQLTLKHVQSDLQMCRTFSAEFDLNISATTVNKRTVHIAQNRNANVTVRVSVGWI